MFATNSSVYKNIVKSHIANGQQITTNAKGIYR
jgi:hypothetical protein